MVFKVLQKSRQTNAFAANHSTADKHNTKRREKQRIRGGDAGSGLLDDDDDAGDPSEAFKPLDSVSLERSCHTQPATRTTSRRPLARLASRRVNSHRSKDEPSTEQHQQSFSSLHVNHRDSKSASDSFAQKSWRAKEEGPQSAVTKPKATTKPKAAAKPKARIVLKKPLPNKKAPASYGDVDLDASLTFGNEQEREMELDENFGMNQGSQISFDFDLSQTDGCDDDDDDQQHHHQQQQQHKEKQHGMKNNNNALERSQNMIAKNAPKQSPAVVSSSPSYYASPPVKRRPANPLMALMHQGDWSNLNMVAPEMKSPDKKPLQAGDLTRRRLVESSDDDSSSNGNDDDDDDDDSSSANPSGDAGSYYSEAHTADDEIEIQTDDDDDESSVESISRGLFFPEDEEPTEVRRQILRMSSGQLRRWNGFHDQVTLLVQQAMPDQVNQVSVILQQFSGREAELVQTLETMIHRRPQSSPLARSTRLRPAGTAACVHRSRGAIRTADPSHRLCATPGRNIMAIASIAAASTIDEHTKVVQPEHIYDDHHHGRQKKNHAHHSDSDEDDRSFVTRVTKEYDDRSGLYSHDGGGDCGSYEDEESAEDYTDDDDEDDSQSSYSEDVSQEPTGQNPRGGGGGNDGGDKWGVYMKSAQATRNTVKR